MVSSAKEVLGEKAVAATNRSKVHPSWDIEDAKELAEKIGLRHILFDTGKLSNPDFVKNSPERCYHCKLDLLEELNEIRKDLGFEKILEGTNLSDFEDYRPGIRAVEEFGDIVASPLSQAGLSKEEIRELLEKRGLSVADKPSSPCLASRVPHGDDITEDRIDRIEKGENFLRSLGFQVVRLRDHGSVARIETDENKILKILDSRKEIVKELKRLGYKHISVDLEGYVTGSLNPTEKEG